jgi:hypothetical protein
MKTKDETTENETIRELDRAENDSICVALPLNQTNKLK